MKTRVLSLKRYICFILSLVMLVGIIPSNVLAADGTYSFVDVKEGDWFYEAVGFVTGEELMVGVGNNRFDPDGHTTRAMVVTVLHRMEGSPAAGDSGFDDVPDGLWYTDAINWAKENKIVEGYGDGTFCPNSTMTREEMVAVFYRYSEYKGYDTTATNTLSTYSDHKTIQKYAVNAMDWAVSVGLITGFPDGTIRPQAESTRAQLAAVLMRFNDNIMPKTYTVVFETNGGSLVEAQQVKAGDVVVPPTPPTKEGYSFVAWCADYELTVFYDFTQPITGNIILYALWQEESGLVSGGCDSTVDVYAITDLTISEEGTKAIAVVSAPENCVMVVRFIEENIYFSEEYPENKAYITEESLYASHIVKAGTNMGEVIADVVGVLPDYYVAEAILFDGEGNALCNPATYIENTTRYEEFESKTVYDFGEDETVIKFGEEDDYNFGVLAGDVKIVYVDELVYDGNTGRYQLIGPDVDIEVGDKVFIYDDATQALVRVDSISENSGIIEIIPAKTEDEIYGYELSDFYSYIKVDMAYNGGLTTEESANQTSAQKPETKIDIVDVDTDRNTSLKIEPISFETDHFRATGNVSGTISSNIVLKWDLKVFGKDYMRCDFTYSSDLNAHLTVVAKWEPDDAEEEKLTIPLVKVQIPFGVPGLTADGEISVELKWKITAGLEIDGLIKTTSGFKYNTKDGFQKVDKKEITWSVSCEGHAELEFGLNISIGVGFLDEVLSADLSCFFGANVEAEATIPVFQGGSSKHGCYLCIDGNVKLVAKVNAKLEYKITKHLQGTPIDWDIIKIEKDLFDFYISLKNDPASPFQGKMKCGTGPCPNCAYKTTFVVCNESGPIDSAEVSVTAKGLGNNVGSVNSGSFMYIYGGTYVANTTIDDVAVSKSFVVSEEAQTVTITKESADGSIVGVVRSAEDNRGIEDARVAVTKNGLVCGEATTDSAGYYRISLAEGIYHYEITADGYVKAEGYIDISDGEEKYMEATLMAVENDDSIMGGIFGTVKDARTGLPISGVKIQAYYGINNVTGSNAATDSPWYTNDEGQFSYKKWSLFGVDFGLPAGNYTLVLSKDEYITTTYNVVIEGGVNNEFNGSISPTSAEGEYRIVLTWGAIPSDLDSHYIGITGEGYVDHVYFNSKDGFSANLDVDDTTSYGPETVYVTNYDSLTDGFYYSVHDYSNRNSNSSFALSNSGATVKLYQGLQLLKTFYVPAGQEGTVWNVFSITEDGKITPINTMEYISSPGAVGRGFLPLAIENGEIPLDIVKDTAKETK